MRTARLVMDSRVPFAAIVAHVSRVTAEKIIRVLDGRLPRAPNIYNCQAFSLNEDITRIVAVDEHGDLIVAHLMVAPISIAGGGEIIEEMINNSAGMVCAMCNVDGQPAPEFTEFIVDYTNKMAN